MNGIKPSEMTYNIQPESIAKYVFDVDWFLYEGVDIRMGGIKYLSSDVFGKLEMLHKMNVLTEEDMVEIRLLVLDKTDENKK